MMHFDWKYTGQQQQSSGKLIAGSMIEVDFTTPDDLQEGGSGTTLTVSGYTNTVVHGEFNGGMAKQFSGHSSMSWGFNRYRQLHPGTTYRAHVWVEDDVPNLIVKLNCAPAPYKNPR